MFSKGFYLGSALWFLCILARETLSHNSFCKATPNTTAWPSLADWTALNASISGQLLAPLPPAAVCDSTLSVYDNQSCSYVTSQFTLSNFHSLDPISVGQPVWENDSCLPITTHHCNLHQYPKYVVNATNAAHVQAGVNFARRRNVRLIVKGTGHDYLGRSTAPNSLSIWTHNLRGLRYQDEFVPQGCSVPTSTAITAAAGHRMFEIYDTAARHGGTIVGGEDPDVGIGGYITGGGHSPISAHYGLAADNILEIELVTPAGELKTVNECTNTDLFFALRGGGGSSFGVILSATFRAIPMPSMAWYHFNMTQENANDSAFWLATASFHAQLPDLIRKGVMGYYNISNLIPGNATTPLQLEAGVWLLNATSPDINAVLDPVLNRISTTFEVNLTHWTRSVSNYYEWWKVQYLPGAVGTLDVRLGSRLLDEPALSGPLSLLAERLRTAYPGLVMLGNLVVGPGVWSAKSSGGLGSMTPAWRKAVVHLITPVVWPFFNTTMGRQQTSLLTNNYTESLRKLAPDSGVYINEADVNEPDLPHAFWGDNYPRLLNIKRQYDPQGVFWCAPCIGSQDWRLTGERLCRV